MLLLNYMGSYLLLCWQIIPKLSVKHNIHLSHQFYGSGFWVQFSWVPLAEGPLLCTQGAGWGCSLIGSTAEEGPTSQTAHMVVSRTQFPQGVRPRAPVLPWLLPKASLGYLPHRPLHGVVYNMQLASLRAGERENQGEHPSRSQGFVLFFCNLTLEVTPHHL